MSEINAFCTHALTAEMMMRQRLDALLALVSVRVKDEARKAEIKRINKIIQSGYEGEESLSGRRNRVVHAFWWGLPTGQAIHMNIKARGKVSYDFGTMSPSDILAVAERTVEITDELEQWLDQVRESPQSLFVLA